MWEPFDNRGNIGQEGSENGTIIRDAEHLGGARITLERDTADDPEVAGKMSRVSEALSLFMEQ